jgi:hypothetical protein
MMAGGNRHSMDGEIQAGDAVVCHINGTLDLYLIATVLSAGVGDLTLSSGSTMTGQDAAIMRGYELRTDDQEVWLFGGSADAYVKAPSAEELLKRSRLSSRPGTSLPQIRRVTA